MRNVFRLLILSLVLFSGCRPEIVAPIGTEELSVSPASWSLSVTNTKTFVASGGVGTVTFQLNPNQSGGTIDPATGLYTAGNVSGVEDTIVVTDGISREVLAKVTVNAALQIAPTTKSMFTDTSFTFTATGGVTPYTFSIVTGTGSINASTGEFLSGAIDDTVTVRVTDLRGNTSDAVVTVRIPVTYAIFDFNNGDLSHTGWSTYAAVPGSTTATDQYQFNAVTSQDGQGALDFYNTGDDNDRSWVDFGSTQDWPVKDKWTFEYWSYLSALKNGYQQKYHIGNIWGQYYAFDGISQSRNRDIVLGTGGSQAYNGYYDFLDFQLWVHYAIVRDGKTFNFYRNGTLIWTYTYPDGTDPNQTYDFFVIGSRPAGGGSAQTNFIIDRVRISSKVRYTSDFTPPATYDLD